MNLTALIRELREYSLPGVKYQDDVKAWVNRAQRAIAQSRSFNFMHSRQTATLTGNTTSVELNARFKELAPEKSPVTFTDPSLSNVPIPCRVRSRAEIEGLFPNFQTFIANSTSGWCAPYYVFIEQNDGGRWTLNIPQWYTAGSTLTFVLSCYLYPADLSAGADSNGLTNDADLSEAIIHWVKAKALAAKDASNPEVAACLTLYRNALNSAGNTDARQRLAGRDFRM